ncbi:MAG: hypothetical protein HY962_07290 [Ignavibacteriae bacterium]|nr:hypothetical protein [Ignavibacteriota bacterium]
MTIEEAVAKGFLNLGEEEVKQVLDSIFDMEDAEQRLGAAVQLLQTFVADDKIDAVLDLNALILDAYDELDYYEEEGEEEGEEEAEDGDQKS